MVQIFIILVVSVKGDRKAFISSTARHDECFLKARPMLAIEAGS